MIALADAIVSLLNDPKHGFSMQFVAERRVVPFDKSEQLKNVKVSVFVGTKQAQQITRDSFQRTYKPVVAIQKKLNTGTEAAQLAEHDSLIALAEQIEAVLEGQDFGHPINVGFVGFDEEQDRDTYGIEALKSHGCYATAITLEYIDE